VGLDERRSEVDVDIRLLNDRQGLGGGASSNINRSKSKQWFRRQGFIQYQQTYRETMA